MATFDEVMAQALGLTIAAERAAAVVAHLRSATPHAAGAAHDPQASALRAVTWAALPDLDALPDEEREMVAGVVVAFFRQAVELAENPDRAPGWTTTDPVVLQAQGRASMPIVPVLARAAAELGDLSMRLTEGGSSVTSAPGRGGWQSPRAEPGRAPGWSA